MNATNHVMFLSLDGMTDPLGQSQVLPYIIGLAERGYRFSIVSLEKENNFKKRESTINGLLEGRPINWYPVDYGIGVPVVSSFINYRKLLLKAAEVCKADSVDLLHCRSYFAALAGLNLRKRFSCKYVFDMRGFWADERIDGNIWPQTNPVFRGLYHYFKKKEKTFLEVADHTVSLTNNAKDEIWSWKRISNNPVPITVIPCCANTELFDREKVDSKDLQELKAGLNINSSAFILLYLGGVGTWYLLDEMLLFFKQMLVTRPHAIFLFVTAEAPEFIHERAKAAGVSMDNIRIIQSERKDVPKYIALSDLSIFFIKPAYSKKASSPTKQAELMSMGTPVICNSGVGDTDYVVERYNSGHLVRELNTENYQKAVAAIDDLMALSPLELRKGAIDYFSLEKGLNLYQEVYQKALS